MHMLTLRGLTTTLIVLSPFAGAVFAASGNHAFLAGTPSAPRTRDPEDTLANDAALRHGGRLFSAYGQGAERFWVITEADRSATSVLLPDDY